MTSRPHLYALLTTLIATTGACLSPHAAPPPRLGVEPPPSWQSGTVEAMSHAPAAPAHGWWDSFEQPRLSASVESALERNFSLDAAAARVDQAVAQARIAGADLAPHVSADTGGARRRQNFIGLPIPGGSGGAPLSSTSTNLGANLNVSWEIDLWGRLRAVREAGRSQAQASLEELAAARLSLSGQTAKAWFAAVESAEQVRLARSTLESTERTERFIRRRYELGLRSALDLRLATSSRASAQSALAARLRRLEASERQLAVLAGNYPTASADASGTLPPMPGTVPVGLPAEMVGRRPDLRASERRLAAVGFAVREARAALYPQLRLTGSLGRVSEDLEDLLDDDFSVWSLAGNLLQPIFQGGRLRANVDRTEAQLREAAADHAQRVLSAFAEVENALGSEQRLADQEAALAEAAEAAEAARVLAEQRYASGLVDYLSVLETQRQAFNVRSQHLQTRRDRLDNRVDLILALGGDLSPEQAPVETARPSAAREESR